MLVPSTLAQTSELLTRAVPSSGERLPAVGLGTADVFGSGHDSMRQKAGAVVQALLAGAAA